MKNIIWAILGIVVILVIVFLGKGGKMQKDQNDFGQVEVNKVYVNESGQELKVVTTAETADLTFGSFGNVKMKSESINAAGRQYVSMDGTLVFLDAGPRAILTQNGEVVFQGEIKESPMGN